MGVIDAPQAVERDTPTMHDDMRPIYSHYKQLRFGRAVSDEVITLIPRQPLQYTELESYTRLVDWQPTQLEVDIIMSIDAIFEMRGNE